MEVAEDFKCIPAGKKEFCVVNVIGLQRRTDTPWISRNNLYKICRCGITMKIEEIQGTIGLSSEAQAQGRAHV